MQYHLKRHTEKLNLLNIKYKSHVEVIKILYYFCQFWKLINHTVLPRKKVANFGTGLPVVMLLSLPKETFKNLS